MQLGASAVALNVPLGQAAQIWSSVEEPACTTYEPLGHVVKGTQVPPEKNVPFEQTPEQSPFGQFGLLDSVMPPQPMRATMPLTTTMVFDRMVEQCISERRDCGGISRS
jgi:hypothetical protein